MTVIEFGWFLFHVGISAIVASFLSRHVSPYLAWGLLPLYFHICIGLNRLVIRVYDSACPGLPICRRRRCRAADYEFIDYSAMSGSRYRCKCGDVYLIRDKKFFVRDACSGDETLYAVKGAMCRWFVQISDPK